ncbi:MAG TPA: EAL domain-containing protein, partial [Acidimicrobiales bacterium]|nr:EAL domain-containing protein [Acidimicrobiales bacterium]
DAGAGFASLRHILHLGPAFVKLDRSWIHGVDADPARQALVAGLRHFAAQTGAELIAEGVEREVERQALLGLGVGYGQGRLLGEPAPLDAA